MNRTLKSRHYPVEAEDGAGVKLKRLFPVAGLDNVDPFILLDHFGSDHPDDFIAGFPLHPHRGIETVTYMLAGRVRHKDSTGHSGAIEAGDVQWMSAGRGIMHEEMPEVADGKLDGLQLWVNLPASEKMKPAEYQESSRTTILSTMKNVFETLKAEGAGKSFPADATKVWELAREVEKKSEDFYREKAAEMEDEKQKHILTRIADEEQKHWIALDNVISFLNRPQQWLEDAEWSDMEG